MTRHRSGRPSLTEVPHEFLSDEWINEARALRPRCSVFQAAFDCGCA